MMNRLFFAIALAAFATPVSAADAPDFNRDVRPILADHCFACHGPDAKARKADLRLDLRKDAIDALAPGKPAESELLRRLLTKDTSEQMPPPKFGKPVKPEQVAILKAWIAAGAEYKGHWAFDKPTRPPVPAFAAARNPIDSFLLERLKRDGLTYSPEADKRTLIRRVTLDLTGLPPTAKEVADYLADESPTAYEKVVDRLLKSIRYAERMTLDWLDAGRYADTHGYHIDSGRDMTRWREYVIRAFDTNMPFDRFTVEQFAGDLLPNPTLEQKIATGFHRNHMINFEGGAIAAEYQTAYVIDRVNTVGTVWLGLSVGCAQCHDHKFDPVSMKDFYSLYAFFNNIPERGLDGSKGNAVPFIPTPRQNQATRVADLKAKLLAIDEKLAAAWPEVDAAQAAWEKSAAEVKADWTPLKPVKVTSRGGATLTTLDDNSVRASGKAPAKEVYTATLKPDLKTATAFRLEALPDDSYPARGPGRGSNGNFVMTGLSVTLGGKPVKVRSATADYSQVEGGFDVKSLLTGGNGWAIFPEVGKPHAAVFEFAEPIAPAGKELVVALKFEATFAAHQVGRFRLSLTDSATPHQAGGPPAAVSAALKVAPAKRTGKQAATVRQYYRETVSPVARKVANDRTAARKELADADKTATNAMVMQELDKPRDTFMLLRGQYDKKGEKVSMRVIESLAPLPKGAPNNRLGLAKWLVSGDHPLTARVTVNRFWQAFFGVGIVKTAEDFGTQGEYPSHPHLLDWLADEFVSPSVATAHRWDVKHIVRLIVTSGAYRQSSNATPELLAKDPENRLLARQSRNRLQAEFLRDQALAVSGLLNGEVGGKSVSPYQPKGIWTELSFRLDNKNFTAQVYDQSSGKDLYRRSMYTFWKRTAPPPSMITLDAPDREVCTVRRGRTNTPLQALVLMNDPTYVEASRKFAERIMTEGGKTTEDRIAFAFETAAVRKPTARETAVLKKVFDARMAKYTADPTAATKLLAIGESPRDAKLPAADLAAWTVVASTILNLDEVLTRN